MYLSLHLNFIDIDWINSTDFIVKNRMIQQWERITDVNETEKIVFIGPKP